ncbi:MAG: hypothetical protein HC805_00995 [Alkalinema sp. RL_2_19]|nr:hypothetical protein [Alkalinema sp. RL_2_19]
MLIKPEPALEKIGVRALRKIATQQGIRNAGRMRKAELLARLTATEGAVALGR